MADPYNFSAESPSLGQPGGMVTLVEGSAFCISGRSGDILAGTPQGLFFRDTRFLSRFELRLNGQQPEPLAATPSDPFSAQFVSRNRPRPGLADSTLVVFRHRYIGRGMREDITVRNFGEEAAYCSLELVIDADFADLFEVKEGRVDTITDEFAVEAKPDELVFRNRRGSTRRGVRVSFGDQPNRIDSNVATFEAVVPPRGEWGVCVQVTTAMEDVEIEPRYQCGHPVERAAPAERLQKGRRGVPQVETDHAGLRSVVAQSAEDLGALRIFDPDFPERTVVAAGAPWFMTLFGRDSILTSSMALLVDPELALGVLQTLARFQGEKVDPRHDEEPGRILHEMRFGEAASLSLGGGRVYYGTADATPLFVMLLGELRRWGVAREAVDNLLPNADRAIHWIEHYGDRDGDGYVEYLRSTDRGLQNQGWKDSWDGIRFADGELARAPIALCEVQAYVYGALIARSHIATEAGQHDAAGELRARALALKVAFNEDFWVDDGAYFAMGLDRDRKVLDAVASNMGHCLWTGIVDEEKAPYVAKHLVSDSMFSGWGIRTLSDEMTGFNPISYHNGSVWPHDNAICAAGLMRYGFIEESHRVMQGIVESSPFFGNLLPELFAGLDRSRFGFPVSYPTSCSPQAWAAASPLLFLRTMLRFEPDIRNSKLHLAPAVPDWIGLLRLDDVELMGGSLTIETERERVHVVEAPAGLEIVAAPRAPTA